MNVNAYIAALLHYGLDRALFEPCDQVYMTNRLLEVLQLDSYVPTQAPEMPLEEILCGLLDDAVSRGVCGDDTTGRDLFDTKLMGALTPAPHEVRREFSRRYALSPESSTQWYYQFSQDTDYIRSYRVCKDLRWKTETE